MNRREIIAATATGAAALAVMPGTAQPASARAQARAQRGPIVAADGTRLHHRAYGSGPTLLFVSSWALHGGMWDYQVAHFSQRGFQCVTLDRRGHGKSDLSEGGYDMDTLADDLDLAIRRLGLLEVVLVGHSMGCAEIVRYLARHGTSRVRGVVMLAPVAPFILATASNAYGAPQAVFDATEEKYATDFPGWAFENQPGFFVKSTSPALADHLTRMLLETPVPVAIECFRSLYRTDLRPDLPAVKVPVLILHGAKDRQAPIAITGNRLAAGIPGARLKTYDDAPHGIWVTHLKQVNADIEQFVRARVDVRRPSPTQSRAFARDDL